jgi:hypothetical protein
MALLGFLSSAAALAAASTTRDWFAPTGTRSCWNSLLSTALGMFIFRKVRRSILLVEIGLPKFQGMPD